MSIPVTDLTQRPPRSVRTRLGGYVLLPRMLDKGRAEIAGQNGEYHYNCPLDQRLLAYLGIEAGALKAELEKGAGDGAMLDWIKASQTSKHSPGEIEAWSAEQLQRGPDAESQEYFDDLLKTAGPNRNDIKTWADLLDLDDYASFGGKA